jgi:hypothetical protein
MLLLLLLLLLVLLLVEGATAWLLAAPDMPCTYTMGKHKDVCDCHGCTVCTTICLIHAEQMVTGG